MEDVIRAVKPLLKILNPSVRHKCFKVSEKIYKLSYTVLYRGIKSSNLNHFCDKIYFLNSYFNAKVMNFWCKNLKLPNMIFILDLESFRPPQMFQGFWKIYKPYTVVDRGIRSPNLNHKELKIELCMNINLTIMCRNDELSWTMGWVGCLLTD